jgi:hypothetical protein
MTLILRLTMAASLVAGAGMAANWTGWLVDSDCFTNEQQNMRAGTPPASWDYGHALRTCTPTAKTKTFAIVQPGGVAVNLDPTSNQKASDFVAKAGKPLRQKVNVTGDMNDKMIRADSITMAK